jgi:hypothetical protein
MSKKVVDKRRLYDIYQYDKHTKKLEKVWNSMVELLKENPTYKRHNIYAACSGEKPSMYGYIWAKINRNDRQQEIDKTTFKL